MPLDPGIEPMTGTEMRMTIGSRSGMAKNKDPDQISESLEKIFLLLKYLNSLMRIRDGKKIGSVIQDKHPGLQH